MNYFLLALTTAALSAQALSTKEYNKKQTNAPIVFTLLSTIFALVVFLFSSKFKLEFNGETLMYSFLFAICYATASLGITVAIASGPLSISSLIQSYSLIIPTFYGILFLNEAVKLTMLIGFLLLVISLFAVNYVKGNEEGQKISKKWIIAIIFTFIGNGMCSTVQKMQQIASGGKYKSEFMISALIIGSIMLLPIVLYSEKGKISISVKKGWFWAAVRGIANGVVNLLVMILGGKLPISLLFPVISAGSIILSSAISVIFYKEKLTKIQLAGVAIGVVSIVFLNL